MATPSAAARSQTRRMIEGSPAWKPHATLALVTIPSRASSSPSCHWPKPSPRSELRSMVVILATTGLGRSGRRPGGRRIRPRDPAARDAWALPPAGSMGAMTQQPVAPAGPAEVRAACRRGSAVHTSGLAPGYTQANLVVLPQDWAYDFLLFAQRNPRPVPLLDVTDAGSPRTV